LTKTLPKGSYSRKYIKKGFKIKMKASGQSFFGLDEIALKGAPTDLSFMHVPLSMDLSRTLGLSVQRVGWTHLWINNRSQGFYLMLEEISQPWVDARFTIDNPGLLKCGSRAELTYNGSSIDDYDFAGTKYSKKLGKRKTVYSNLLGLVSALNESDWFAPTGKQLNLTQILSYMVAEYFISDTDSYTQFGNNYWLLSFDNGFMQLVPHDQVSLMTLASMRISPFAHLRKMRMEASMPRKSGFT
jgi:spore coat protein CotH